MTKKYTVAVVGATGAVGETMLSILKERKFPIENIYALASSRSVDKTVQYGSRTLIVEDLAEFDFKKADIALFSAGGSVSAQYAPVAGEAGCIVIDNTSHFRNEKDIPLVIPEVNPDALNDYKPRNIIANPNCSTIQMLVALAPIHKAVGISRINVATYQSVSGAGQKGIEELANQTKDLLTFQTAKKEQFTEQIAFNVIPQIDSFEENGYTREEMKMVWETQKILGDEKILVNPTCVRVPVFYGHSEAVHIETKNPMLITDVIELLSSADGVEVVDNPSELKYPTPTATCSGNDPVYVGRIRKDITNENGINMWIVSDNIRKGAALNSVQIAEQMIKMQLI
jgi:aspartate-semialdehyde dehydrogenase